MHKFGSGTLVKHKENNFLLFEVLAELESVPPGGPSLYRCMPLRDEQRLYKYHEDDLYAVQLTDEEIQKHLDG